MTDLGAYPAGAFPVTRACGYHARAMAAVLLALLTILVWSSLALLNSRVNALPPFLAVGVALCVGRPRRPRPRPRMEGARSGPSRSGSAGIFGYHALLFAAFSIAPAVEVNLINYLWPLLIVLLSPVFLRASAWAAARRRGRPRALAGPSSSRRREARPRPAYMPGYLLAAAAALAWACYSLLTKRLPPFPTGAVGGFCLVSGLLSLGHLFPRPGAAGRAGRARAPGLGLALPGPLGPRARWAGPSMPGTPPSSGATPA